MTFRRFAIALGVLALCTALGYRAGSAEPKADDSKKDSLEVRCAKLQLRLAELGLEKAQNTNRRVARTIPLQLVAQYADDVAVAKIELENASREPGAKLLEGWILRAEMAYRTAQNIYVNAAKTEKRTPDTYEPIDLERMKATAELAQLQVERGKSLVDASPDAKLQWVTDMVDDDLMRLKKQTALLFQDRGPTDL